MPYIPHTKQDVADMLETIGVSSVDDLFVEVPENLRVDGRLNLPDGLDEHRLAKSLSELAAKNVDLQSTTCFLGAGIYDRFVPASVGAIISRGEFLTSYTPYQPEASQGYLQTIYEFQTMIAELYGCDLANASMYDGPTAMAEAALMAVGATRREKVAVSQAVHPHYRQVLRTYCWSLGVEVVELPYEKGLTVGLDRLDETFASLVWQTPNFFGLVEDDAELVAAAQSVGALSVATANPTAMALLPPPGEKGADVVVGEGQPLGLAMGFGGPMLGLYGCKAQHVRRLPGRIVGRTVDGENRVGYTMTLRTREQDIRREKATSNICTNEALMALAATVYMTALGKNGMRRVAEGSVRNARYLRDRLAEAGAQPKFEGTFFDEFVVTLPRPAAETRDALLDRKILAGLPLGEHYAGMENDLLVCATEIRTRAEIDAYAEALREVL